jgi:hypothetical protein
MMGREAGAADTAAGSRAMDSSERKRTRERAIFGTFEPNCCHKENLEAVMELKMMSQMKKTRRSCHVRNLWLLGTP